MGGRGRHSENYHLREHDHGSGPLCGVFVSPGAAYLGRRLCLAEGCGDHQGGARAGAAE